MERRYSIRHFIGAPARMRKLPTICKGALAEDLVAADLLARGFYVVEGGEGQVDWLAARTEEDHLKYPLEVKGIEVINYPLTRHVITIRKSKVEGEHGPFFIIMVEIADKDEGSSNYVCLIFTYDEMPTFLREKGHERKKDYWFSVPRIGLLQARYRAEYEKYFEKWSKITDWKEDDLDPDDVMRNIQK